MRQERTSATGHPLPKSRHSGGGEGTSAFDPLQTPAIGLPSRAVKLGLSRRSKWLLLTVVVAVTLLALTWNSLALGLGFASSETRPALLSDVAWGKPETAAAFHQRFGNGNYEADLLRWLRANHFEIDGGAHRASLKVHGLPCNEDIAVTWTAANGILHESRAIVSEAGCL
jgi:hypothetical protein